MSIYVQPRPLLHKWQTELNYSPVVYYTASSASGQDEPNRALRLATWAGKMEPSCPLGTTCCIPQVKCTKSHIINPLLAKYVQSRWLDIGLVLFFQFMDLDFVSVHKHAKKELGQYPAILTSHVVNNPYIMRQKTERRVRTEFRRTWQTHAATRVGV